MMQASDMILGLLIIFLCGWAVMLAVGQKALEFSVNALDAKQASEAVIVSPAYCGQVAGYALVRAPELAEKEYYTTAGFNRDVNRAFICLYRQA